MRKMLVAFLAASVLLIPACTKEPKITVTGPKKLKARVHVHYDANGGKPKYKIEEKDYSPITLKKNGSSDGSQHDKIQWSIKFSGSRGEKIEVRIQDFKREGGGSSPFTSGGGDCATSDPNKFCLQVEDEEGGTEGKPTRESGGLGENGTYKYSIVIKFPNNVTLTVDPQVIIGD